ncbi:hypothetical protein B0H13DRAFT_2554684 [Mycena leptocephala]|nr:hypothetical protein B0H13DRAFT_2554684 [Mycena leptocephala]
MTPDEIKTLRTIGHDVVRGFVAITNETPICHLGTQGDLRPPLQRQATTFDTAYLARHLIMFFIAVVLWALDLANFIMEASSPSSGNRRVIRVFVSSGDAIILWRVFNLKGYYRPWVFIFPLALLLGSLISTLMLTYCVAAVGSDIVIGAFEKPAFCRNVQLVTYATACATTTVATILVGLTVWNYRQTIGPMLKDSFLASQGNKQPRRSQAETILLLLLESGVLYFLFFAVQFVAAIPRIHEWVSAQPAVSFALTMYAFCSSVIVGIYPTAVITLAHYSSVLGDAAAAASMTASTLREAPTPSRSPDVWPTFHVGTQPADDIELRIETNSSSTDLHRLHHKPRAYWDA